MPARAPGDAFGLNRFLEAQRANYQQALSELRAGLKRTHWSWYILPQLTGLGSSAMSTRYAIRSLAEAKAYLDHPVLGARLREWTVPIRSLAQRCASTSPADRTRGLSKS